MRVILPLLFALWLSLPVVSVGQDSPDVPVDQPEASEPSVTPKAADNPAPAEPESAPAPPVNQPPPGAPPIYQPVVINADSYDADYTPEQLTFRCFEAGESGQEARCEAGVDLETLSAGDDGSRTIVAGSISERDAAFSSYYLPKYGTHNEDDYETLDFENYITQTEMPHGAGGQTFAITGGFYREVNLFFQYDEGASNPSQGIFKFTADLLYNPDALGEQVYSFRLEKTMSWRANDGYSWDFSYNFINTDSRPIPFEITATLPKEDEEDPDQVNSTSFGITWGPGIGPELESRSRLDVLRLNVQPLASGNEFFWDQRFDKFAEDVTSNVLGIYRDPRWFGVDSRYFLAAMAQPNEETPALKPRYPYAMLDTRVQRNMETQGMEGSEIDATYLAFMFDGFVLEPGQAQAAQARVYIGPKDRDILELNSSFGTRGNLNLKEVIDRSSWFGGAFFNLLAIGFEYILEWLYSWIGSWGLAIIVLTLMLKIVLHPLLQKGMMTQEKMKILQPRLKQIQQQYKDPMERQRQVQQVMRKEGVSVLGGGCLTFLPQIPIFFALYLLFPNFIDIRGESFLWIDNLGNPDVLFGIPFWPNEIHLLPILMAAIMFFQTMLMPVTSPSGDPQQAKLQRRIFMFVLPPLFLFIFWTFPAALVLFWTVNTALQVIHQYLIRRIIAKRKAEGKFKVAIDDVAAPPAKGSLRGKGGGKVRKKTTAADFESKKTR